MPERRSALKGPWVVLQGSPDWQTPTHMAKADYDKVYAPGKPWIAVLHQARRR
jgi:hypothetical protein